MEYLFTFDDTFEIHDDIEVLKRMGMALGLHKASCTEENLAKVGRIAQQQLFIRLSIHASLESQQAKSYVPKALEHYVDQLANGQVEPQWPENVNPSVKDPLDPFGSQVGVRAVTPTASVSTGFSDSEEDDVDDDEDNSDVEIN